MPVQHFLVVCLKTDQKEQFAVICLLMLFGIFYVFFLNLYHVYNSNSVLLSTAMPQFTHAYDNNRFLLLWRYNDQTDKIFYHLRVKTTGWVGFGFAATAPNNMMNYDVIVGGFNNGQGYLFVSFLRVSHYSNRSAACLFSGFSTI